MFARTKRLTLRPAWPEDAAALAGAIGHREVATRLSRVPWPYTREHAAHWIDRSRERGVLFFLVFDHPEGEAPRLVGSVGLHREEGAIELGYWYTPAAWGRGYATEAGRAAIDAARHGLGIRRFASGYHLDNPASGRVLRKLGFAPTGEVRRMMSLARGCEVATMAMELDLGAAKGMPIAA